MCPRGMYSKGDGVSVGCLTCPAGKKITNRQVLQFNALVVAFVYAISLLLTSVILSFPSFEVRAFVFLTNWSICIIAILAFIYFLGHLRNRTSIRQQLRSLIYVLRCLNIP